MSSPRSPSTCSNSSSELDADADAPYEEEAALYALPSSLAVGTGVSLGVGRGVWRSVGPLVGFAVVVNFELGAGDERAAMMPFLFCEEGIIVGFAVGMLFLVGTLEGASVVG